MDLVRAALAGVVTGSSMTIVTLLVIWVFARRELERRAKIVVPPPAPKPPVCGHDCDDDDPYDPEAWKKGGGQ